ncbi:hypothetical protein [Bradyrhizobium sp. CW1]|uniref:hypothetical protein n=1 Tax=Bradyrhizobium sp. CW1 TaxID=2782686 RepID=UPI0020001375|nr:hypothetical protein [Bradyrhizobium sp. CW1]UPJ31003.1 hypothetical protein IVB54_19350 [Bradyrhizobium sp. CW1]
MKKRVAITKRAKALLAVPPSVRGSEKWEGLDSAWGAKEYGAFSLDKPKGYIFPDTGWTPIPEGSEIDRWNEANLRAIRRAFAHFGLSPEDPYAWRLLVEYLAFAFFWKGPKTRGAPEKWTREKMADLAAIVATFPGMSDTSIAKKLANDRKSSFYVKGTNSSDGVSGLRRRIGKARKKLATN